MAQDLGEPDAQAGVTADRLVVLLGELGLAAEAHRRSLARRLDLVPVDLLCLDVVRRLGPVPSSALVSWTGVTRSALSKSLRRLEERGHVVRRHDTLTNGEVEVVAVEHAERDRLLDEVWSTLRRTMAGLVVDLGLADRERYQAIEGWATTTATTLFRGARVVAEEEARRTRRRERDRREEVRRDRGEVRAARRR